MWRTKADHSTRANQYVTAGYETSAKRICAGTAHVPANNAKLVTSFLPLKMYSPLEWPIYDISACSTYWNGLLNISNSVFVPKGLKMIAGKFYLFSIPLKYIYILSYKQFQQFWSFPTRNHTKVSMKETTLKHVLTQHQQRLWSSRLSSAEAVQ